MATLRDTTSLLRLQWQAHRGVVDAGILASDSSWTEGSSSPRLSLLCPQPINANVPDQAPILYKHS